MFRFFWKKAFKLNEIHSDELQNLDEMNVWYQGEVISGDYNPENPADYPFHNLFPHGHGHLVYKRNGQVIEKYEGDFYAGQYHGQGILIDDLGKTFKGEFFENRYIGNKKILQAQE